MLRCSSSKNQTRLCMTGSFRQMTKWARACAASAWSHSMKRPFFNLPIHIARLKSTSLSNKLVSYDSPKLSSKWVKSETIISRTWQCKETMMLLPKRSSWRCSNCVSADIFSIGNALCSGLRIICGPCTALFANPIWILARQELAWNETEVINELMRICDLLYLINIITCK